MKARNFLGQDWKNVMEQVVQFLGTPGIELLNVRLTNGSDVRTASVIYSFSPPVLQHARFKLTKWRTKVFVHCKESGVIDQFDRFIGNSGFKIDSWHTHKSVCFDQTSKLYILKFTYPVE